MSCRTVYYSIMALSSRQRGRDGGEQCMLYSVKLAGMYISVAKAQRASSNLSYQEARFSPTVLSRICFKPRLGYHNMSHLFVDIRVERHELTPYLSMTFANWSLQKWVPRSLMIARGAPNLEKRVLRNLQNNSGIIGGERFCFNLI
ncbi:hypothetical protein Tco_0120834 [Tanacetum coccineum]